MKRQNRKVLKAPKKGQLTSRQIRRVLKKVIQERSNNLTK